MIDPDRCPSSLQETMTTESPSTCPGCAERVAVITIDGRPCLVEHRRRTPEALPMSLNL